MPTVKSKQVEGNFEGGFLRGSSGSFGSYSTIILRWQADDGLSYFAELPLKSICIKNSNVKQPLIKFIFDIDFFKIDNYNYVNIGLLSKNPSLLVSRKTVFQATILISQRDINKYLIFK